MSVGEVALLFAVIFAIALLYSTVGHAGASGYLAAMALVGLSAAQMKPTALLLNILVSVIATVRFYRAGCFVWRIFWPFAVTSIPCALLGGMLRLPDAVYDHVVGLVLLFAAWRLIWSTSGGSPAATRTVPLVPALVLGAAIGLLSGLTGVGGGIFLSPLLMLVGWANARQTAGVSAAFILVNSLAGLVGHLAVVQQLPPALFVWGVAAVAGGIVGSGLGSHRFGDRTLRRLMAAVLTVAALKLVLV